MHGCYVSADRGFDIAGALSCYSANLASFLLQKENLDCKAKGLKQLSIYQGCANLQSPLVA